MGAIPAWIEIPRADLDARGSYALPVGFRIVLALTTLFLFALAVGLAWSAGSDPEVERPAVQYGLAAVLGAFAAYLLSVVLRFGDRVETTPEELRVHRHLRGAVAVPWSRIESLRVRKLLRRVDVHSSSLRRPIRLELQLERVDTLLMVLAERTFHLLDAAAALAADFAASRSPERVGRRARRGRWSIEEDGLAGPEARVGFAQVADLRILRIGSASEGHLVLIAQLRGGSAVVLHLGAGGLVEQYQRARRAHRSWFARNETTALQPLPISIARPAGARRALALLASFALAVVIGVASVAVRNPERISRLWRGEPERVAIGRGLALFRTHRYQEVVGLAEAHFADHEPARENLLLLHLQARSYRKLDRPDEAIGAYERGLPVVRRLDDVGAEPFGRLFYEVAELYQARGEVRRAVERLEEGLRLRPRSHSHRALLAAWYQDLGDDDRAVRLFRELLDAAPEGSEPHAVALRRLGRGPGLPPGAQRAAPRTRPELARELAIAVVPFNEVDPRVDLGSVCLVLEAKLWIPCAVLPSQRIPEEQLLDPERNQYDAGRVVPVLHAGIARIAPAFLAPEDGIFLLGVTSRDIFAGGANFLFSSSSEAARVAVVSSYRLLEDLPAYWDPDALAGRRVAIQALSAVGALLGLERPVSEHCPLAYPNGVDAFLLKRGELCASTVEERDALLARRGGERIHHDARREAAVERVHRAHLLD